MEMILVDRIKIELGTKKFRIKEEREIKNAGWADVTIYGVSYLGVDYLLNVEYGKKTKEPVVKITYLYRADGSLENSTFSLYELEERKLEELFDEHEREHELVRIVKGFEYNITEKFESFASLKIDSRIWESGKFKLVREVDLELRKQRKLVVENKLKKILSEVMEGKSEREIALELDGWVINPNRFEGVFRREGVGSVRNGQKVERWRLGDKMLEVKLKECSNGKYIIWNLDELQEKMRGMAVYRR